jgi:integrase
LNDAEIAAMLRAVEAQPGPFSSLVRFLLLSAARRSEASDMTWGEIVGDVWTIPAARCKTKKDVAIPLSGAAWAVLDQIPRIGGCRYVFTASGRRPVSSVSNRKAKLDAASGVTGWTLHDLRRTARSLMSRAGVNADIAERCLGHVIGGVRGTYDRHEYLQEKRAAFEALAEQIGNIRRKTRPRENS